MSFLTFHLPNAEIRCFSSAGKQTFSLTGAAQIISLHIQTSFTEGDQESCIWQQTQIALSRQEET